MLDDLGHNLKHAKELGMTTIQVKDPFTALTSLKEITGIDVSIDDDYKTLPDYTLPSFMEYTVVCINVIS